VKWLVILCAACAHPASDGGPADTLNAYLSAIHNGRASEAYALMSDEYKKAHDLGEFEREVRRSTQAQALPDPQKKWKAVERAEVTLPDGEVVTLVWQDGWRLGWNPLDYYPQSTPAEALRSFLRAIELDRFDVVLRFVPTRHPRLTESELRQRWQSDPDHARQAKAAAVALEAAQKGARPSTSHDDPFLHLTADEAKLAISEKKQVRTVREDGLWKIESLE
jgi:hypothetical protein